jgi:hypothetical protein
MSSAVSFEASAPSRLFEAFFLIEPVRNDPAEVSMSARIAGASSIVFFDNIYHILQPFSSTRVLYSVPEDASKITKEFRDIPQFCFPGAFIAFSSVSMLDAL